MTIESTRRRFLSTSLVGGAVTIFGAQALAACDAAEKILGSDALGDTNLPDVNLADVTLPDVEIPDINQLLETLKLDDGYLIADPKTGRLYRLDQEANTVTQLNADLTERWTFGGFGEETDKLNFPVSVTPTGDGSVYILDQGNSRMMKITADGAFDSVIGGTDGTFNSLRAAVVDAEGNVWATDPLSHAIQGFKPDGTALRTLGELGEEATQLNGPRGLSLDADGNLHVVDSGNARIQVFGRDGAHLRSYGSYGVEDGRHLMPRSIAIAPNGLTYVADPVAGAIQVYNKAGTAIARLDDLTLAGLPAVPLDVSITAAGLMQVRLHTWEVPTPPI